jgi:phosphoribosylformylglycinamidine synthase
MPVAEGAGHEPERLLFCETPSRFLVSVAPRHQARWERIMAGSALGRIGEATAEHIVRIEAGGREIAALPLRQIRDAWIGSGWAAP